MEVKQRPTHEIEKIDIAEVTMKMSKQLSHVRVVGARKQLVSFLKLHLTHWLWIYLLTMFQ